MIYIGRSHPLVGFSDNWLFMAKFKKTRDEGCVHVLVSYYRMRPIGQKDMKLWGGFADIGLHLTRDKFYTGTSLRGKL
jgi:hypothetical protein